MSVDCTDCAFRRWQMFTLIKLFIEPKFRSMNKLSDGTKEKIHLTDRRRIVGTVCGDVVPARQIGTYAESLLILGDKTIVRREVFAFLTRVKRHQRCKKCFRSAERFL